MEIKVLSPGCPRYKALEQNVINALDELDVGAANQAAVKLDQKRVGKFLLGGAGRPCTEHCGIYQKPTLLKQGMESTRGNKLCRRDWRVNEIGNQIKLESISPYRLKDQGRRIR